MRHLSHFLHGLLGQSAECSVRKAKRWHEPFLFLGFKWQAFDQGLA